MSIKGLDRVRTIYTPIRSRCFLVRCKVLRSYDVFSSYRSFALKGRIKNKNKHKETGEL